MAVTVATYDNAAVWGPIVVSIVIVLANLLAWALNERSWAYRKVLSRVGVPRMLFISNRAEGVPKTARPQTYWNFDLLDPHHLVQSPVLNTFGLLLLHGAIFLYWIATVMVDVVVEYYGYGCHGSWCNRHSGAYAEWMTFLTNWSISILGISGFVAFFNTLRYAKRQRHARAAYKQQRVELGARNAAHQHTAHRTADHHTAPVAQTAPMAERQTGSNPGAGEWVQVFHRPGADAWAGPGALRDRDQAQPRQGAQQDQKLSQGQGDGVEAQQPSSPDGSSCNSTDTVVVVGPQAGHHRRLARTEKWDWLSRTHCILSEVATAAAWFVSFWFWVGLVGIAGQAFNANGGTIMAHAGNFVLALAVVLLTRLPLVSTHFQVLLWYASLYMIFLLAYGGGSGTWRYGLDVQKAKPAGALIIVPFMVFIFFCIWYLVARLREAVVKRARLRHARHHDKHAQNDAVTAEADAGLGADAGADAAV